MDHPNEIHVAVLGAVIKEVEPLFTLLHRTQSFDLHGQEFRLGKYADRWLLVGTTGLGKVNAAITAAALLERFPIRQVWNVGCSGAYPEGPLQVGDVLITERSLCGDEGILSAMGISSSREIGIPILVHNGQKLYDRIPLDRHISDRKIREKTPEGRYRLEEGTAPAVARTCRTPHDAQVFQLVYGPSLTVGMVSGDRDVAGQRFLQYEAFAENMEGSAIAQACFRFDVPVIECRGMSNTAGNRSKGHWRIERAVAHCHGIILNWLTFYRGECHEPSAKADGLPADSPGFEPGSTSRALGPHDDDPASQRACLARMPLRRILREAFRSACSS